MPKRHDVKINLAASQIRHITYQGAPHLVVPAVMLTPGVHNGSSGPLLYEAIEIQSSAPRWNGRPVTVGHPVSSNTPISAVSTPEVYEKSIGIVWNARFEDGKLKALLYLNEDRTQQIAPHLLHALLSGRQIEISTGFFSTDQQVSGSWNSKRYVGIIRDINPDHLAVLLDQKGACSWEDGCGIRVNTSSSLTTNLNEVLHLCGTRTGGTAMREQEPLVLPVLNNAEGDEKCPCGKGKRPIPDEPEALDLPLLHGRER